MNNLQSRLLVLACFAPYAAQGGIINITVDTSTLIAHIASPFYIDLQFTDGSGIGDGNNTVVVDNFSFGAGGFAVGNFNAPQGDVSGDLSSGVTLNDTQFFNEFGQEFNPGTTLSFRVNLTSNIDGGTPDGFTFSILDSSLSPIPTLEPFGQDFIFAADITGADPSTQAYDGDPSRSPAAGGPAIPFSVHISGNSTDVPEPGMMWPTLGLLLFAAGVRTGRWKKAQPRGTPLPKN